ncbi:hypothetical protein CRUP_024136, partial [Coryphaenoides rupestris]
AVQVFGVQGQSVQSQEGVGVPRRAVTQPVALLQEAPPPHHLPTLHRRTQVLRLPKHLKEEEEHVDNPRGAVAPVHQQVALLAQAGGISEAILASGVNLSRKLRLQEQSPLMYEWYQEHYVGAAHGLAGIYYYLMQPGFVAGEERVHGLVRPSVDYVSRLHSPAGNYPACLGEEGHLLVHWCHGAPGVVYMLLQAY